MSKKGENIYKRKDGRWEGRYPKGRNENGKLIYGYIYAPKYSMVRKKLNVLKAQYGDFSSKVSLYEGTVEEWLTFWLHVTKENIKPSTYANYNSRIENYIVPFLGKKKLIHLTNRHTEGFMNHLIQLKLAPATVRSIFMVLKSATRKAFQGNYILTDPCNEIKMSFGPMKEVAVLTKQEQKKIETVAFQETECSPVVLALYTGLRIGEISGLKWSDIDFERDVIYVRRTLTRVSVKSSSDKTKVIFSTPKTKSSLRSIPLAKNLKYYLEQKQATAKATSEFVISCKGTYAEPRVISYRFRKTIEQAGIRRIHFHMLRHTFATRCVEQGIDIATVSKLLGHSSIKMTLDTYTDSLWESRKEAVAILDNQLKESVGMN